MKNIPITLIFLCCFTLLNAQTNIDQEDEAAVYEDVENETSIQWPGGSSLRVNTKDASVKIAYSQLIDKTDEYPWMAGLTLTGKTNDGVMPVFSAGRFSPGFQVGGFIGRYLGHQVTDKNVSWVTVSFGYEGSRLKFVDPDTTFESITQKKNFGGGRLIIAYNIIPNNSTVWGFSLGFLRKNNYADLDDLQLVDSKIFMDPVSGHMRTIEQEFSGKNLREYHVFNQLKLQQDVYSILKPRIGLYQYSRFTYDEINDFKMALGAGIYFLRSSVLFSRVGIMLSNSDVLDLNGWGTKTTLNLIVGFKFAN